MLLDVALRQNYSINNFQYSKFYAVNASYIKDFNPKKGIKKIGPRKNQYCGVQFFYKQLHVGQVE